ncbi:FxsB family cyclophane-forming radical SAM/SPASM peptide maturase [Peterkaempfera griseoplana]|uniref:FxsB family cyclophane-forming radical SAM/SPASM peptide maturase n=1 Tax=Peterkaempfera griseoplana TaxID=66896 RepID=UPI0006E2F71C|nr:FxsB family cyclophane-forming radical SAM/SPASM peptide maturase [Peterkaempfera griseoplana]
MSEGLPFRQFVVKLHSLCNIACDHCYVYELRDSGWRSRPSVMADRTMEQVVRRINEHVRRHGLPRTDVVLHGGEPMLAGQARVDRLATELGRALDGATRLRISLQTNGTLLDESWLSLFHRHRIAVGVSLDGDRTANDRHRRRADGRSSHPAVRRGLQLLRKPEHRERYAGLLCTVDLANPPIATYEALLAEEPPVVDLLLPHATWQYPPPGHDPARAPYAAWLIPVFDRWYQSREEPRTRIRLFESLLDLALGGSAVSESVGGAPPGFIVVETDGTIQLADAYRAVDEGASETGLDVFAQDFDTVARAPRVAETRLGRAGLAADCVRCQVVDMCGGGNRAHRFRPGSAFDNPSVYCADLMRLAEHIRRRVRSDIRVLLGDAR